MPLSSDNRYRLPLMRLIAITLAVLCTACVVQGTGEGGAPAGQAASAAPGSAASSQAPAAPETPPLRTEQRVQTAQKLSTDALELLQNGEESSARSFLEHALRLDPGNEVARKLLDQIRADARAELGATNFAYTVQPGDSLAKIAQAFLGDRYRFYILAKYNGIGNPSRVAVGQVIKIPGQAPPKLIATEPAAHSAKPPVAPAPPAAARVATDPAPVAAAEPTSPRRREAERLYAEGLGFQKSGNTARAYDAFKDAVGRDPTFELAAQQRDAARRELIARYQRDATAAFHRQDLDGSIRNWDLLLALDPDDQNARLKRAQAVDLKQRLNKFNTK
jgi:tetratricopeptide (TPR) repeat protein